MKELKKTACVILSIAMVITFLMPTTKAEAATFENINQSSVFVQQQTNYTCTLASAVMMVRRAAMMSGNTNWASITESSMRSTAWLEGSGLYWSFNYAGISVSHASLPGGSSNENILINLLVDHPEGIEIYNTSYPHAVLLTDYTDGVFYIADPATSVGRVPISQATGEVSITSVTQYWFVSSPSVSLTNSVFVNDEITSNIPSDAVEFNGHYYCCYYENLSWSSAKAKCESLGGHLATITTSEEESFIEELNGSYNLWIGGYRDDNFAWMWVTGEEWNYTNWGSGEPNNSSNVKSNENSIAVWPVYWNDLNNNNLSEQSGFICEWENENQAKLGDVNEDDQITSNDAVYLLMHTQFPLDYILPNGMDCDFNVDGRINSKDAIYLLMYTQFPDTYPLNSSK